MKLRLLTGTYSLQEKLFRIGKSNTNICQLCLSEEEDTIHFVTTCKTTTETRIKYLPAILDITRPKRIDLNIAISPEIMTHLLIDPNHPVITSHLNLSHQDVTEIEEIAQKLVYALHLRRTDALKTLSVAKI